MTHGQNHNLRALAFIHRHQLKKPFGKKLKNHSGAYRGRPLLATSTAVQTTYCDFRWCWIIVECSDISQGNPWSGCSASRCGSAFIAFRPFSCSIRRTSSISRRDRSMGQAIRSARFADHRRRANVGFFALRLAQSAILDRRSGYGCQAYWLAPSAFPGEDSRSEIHRGDRPDRIRDVRFPKAA